MTATPFVGRHRDSMQEAEVTTYEQRLAPLGGVIEWCTSLGLGVRFDAGTLTDEQLASLQDVRSSPTLVGAVSGL